MAQSVYIDDNQNHLGRQFMASDCDYFFLANDDQVYADDTIGKLAKCIEETGAGVAVPLCLSRQPPFFPLLYDEETAPSTFKPRLLKNGDAGKRIPVLVSGGGGMLIRRDVMEKLGDPWWNNGTIPGPNGKPIHVGEDVSFCQRVRAAGYTIMADMSAIIGHIATFEIKPQVLETGDWATTLERHGTTVAIPAPKSE
jgi:GT2 family glycosyltransferase